MLDVREENLDENLDELSPIQQFIFQYGWFIIQWNDFNLCWMSLSGISEQKCLVKKRAILHSIVRLTLCKCHKKG